MQNVPTEARETLGAAQFILGPDAYTAWAWAERAKASTAPPKPSKAWPFKRFEDQSNVVEISRKKVK